MEATEILTKARDHLKEVGLHKKNFCLDSDDKTVDEWPVCVLGAIRWAATGEPRVGPIGSADYWTYQRALELLEERVEGSDVVGFNDAPSTTLEDVIALLDSAINS